MPNTINRPVPPMSSGTSPWSNNEIEVFDGFSEESTVQQSGSILDLEIFEIYITHISI